MKHCWIDDLRPGDIVQTRSGKLRVVRAVNKRNGFVYHVVFSILRCSWTRRPYTVYYRTDLIHAGYQPTGKRRRLTRKIDKQLAAAVENHRDRSMTCCDVEGIS